MFVTLSLSIIIVAQLLLYIRLKRKYMQLRIDHKHQGNALFNATKTVQKPDQKQFKAVPMVFSDKTLAQLKEEPKAEIDSVNDIV
jgi:hypothetical protein